MNDREKYRQNQKNLNDTVNKLKRCPTTKEEIEEELKNLEDMKNILNEGAKIRQNLCP